MTTNQLSESEKLKLIISKHDAIPRTSWSEVSEGTFRADSEEVAYEKWLTNFAADIEAYTASAVQAEMQSFVDWVQRVHVEPDNDEDRWCVAGKEIVEEGKKRIATLSKAKEEA